MKVCILGVTINNFISYSQRYNIPSEPVEKTNSFQYFAFSENISVGLNKKFSDFYFGPHIILPYLTPGVTIKCPQKCQLLQEENG